MSVFSINYRNANVHGVFAVVKSVLADLRNGFALQRTRHVLAQLDDRMLSDIGVSRAMAGTEAERPIWDAGLR
jgi:uncharacterized protein YjiS (DUF1127 family)